MQMTFTSYEVQDTGVNFRFSVPDPDATITGVPQSDWYVFMTDAEINATATVAALRTAVTAKLTRKFRKQGISTRLDPLIGSTITV